MTSDDGPAVDAGAGEGKVRAWLDLARVSNLPTCLSNVLVGVAIGVSSASVEPGATASAFPWTRWAGVSLAVALMYIGGMVLNDAIDAPIDREQRSGRPIPSGRIGRGVAFLAGFLALISGVLAVLGVVGGAALAWGLALAAAIVLYDLVHKKIAASVVIMGLCRGLVFVISAAAVTRRPDWIVLGTTAGAMTIYITLVTTFARREHIAAAPHFGWLDVVLPVIPLVATVVIRPEHPGRAVAIGLLVILWLGRSSFLLRRPPRPKDAVMGWLSGICLIDAYTLTLLDQRLLAMIAVGLFVVTWRGHQRILGT